jgi:hypothetical protein
LFGKHIWQAIRANLPRCEEHYKSEIYPNLDRRATGHPCSEFCKEGEEASFCQSQYTRAKTPTRTKASPTQLPMSTAARRAINNIMATSARTFTLEIERKFLPTARLRSQLDGNSDDHRYRFPLTHQSDIALPKLQAKRLPDMSIRDTYLDVGNCLEKHGIWIRRRAERVLMSDEYMVLLPQTVTETWEAKIKLGGDYADSQFEEVSGEEEVKALVVERVPGMDLGMLKPVADLEAHRSTWTVKDKHAGSVTIVLDDVIEPGSDQEAEDAFHHLVGEVELTEENTGGMGRTEHEELKKRRAEEMRLVLNQFMTANSVLFPTEVPVKGKLGAYFTWKSQKGKSSLE